MMLYSSLLLACVVNTWGFGLNIVREQVETYKSLLQTDRLTFDGFKSLIQLHDDWECSGPCEVFVKKYMNDDQGIDWNVLVDTIVDKLYEDHKKCIWLLPGIPLQ